jgi:hypothetical protein
MNDTTSRYRVLAVATHPVQYMAPIFRRMWRWRPAASSWLVARTCTPPLPPFEADAVNPVVIN